MSQLFAKVSQLTSLAGKELELCFIVLLLYYQELEKEKEENRRLEKLIEERDRRIAELERDMALMNKVCYMY